MQDLKYATLATVSRCGMVWFSEDVLSVEMIFENYLARLCNIPVEETEEDVAFLKKTENKKDDEITPTLQVGLMTQVYFVNELFNDTAAVPEPWNYNGVTRIERNLFGYQSSRSIIYFKVIFTSVLYVKYIAGAARCSSNPFPTPHP